MGVATDRLGSGWGPEATGVLQSGLGNLPELIISVFALRAGLVRVLQAALISSILANSLLVLGLAFLYQARRPLMPARCPSPPTDTRLPLMR